MGFILDMFFPMSGVIMRMMLLRMVLDIFSISVSVLPSYLIMVRAIVGRDMGGMALIYGDTVFLENLASSHRGIAMQRGLTAVACSFASADT